MFSNLVLEYKDSVGAGNNLVNETNNFFKKEYFNNNKPDKKFSPPFIPGEVYFFKYQTDSKPSSSRPFINRFPVVLCTDVFPTETSGTVVKGIDLIVVPPRIRIDIIGKIYDYFLDKINLNNSSYKKGGTKSPINLSDQNLKGLLPGTGYKEALFGFKYKFIKDPGVIGVGDWPKIPYLSLNVLEGSSIQGIYKEYQSKLNR